LANGSIVAWQRVIRLDTATLVKQIGGEKVCHLPSDMPNYSLNGVRSILNGFFPLVTRFAQRKKNSESKQRFGFTMLKEKDI
jgi:hypothetical protein